MIGRIHGSVISVNNGRAVVMPDGCAIGYVIILPVNLSNPEVGAEAGFWIWHAISQDDQRLFGFDTADERWLAELIATTHRVGPGIAHKTVTTLGYLTVTAMIRRGDDVGLAKAVKGLGAKTASSIITNLRGRLGEIVATQDHRVRQVQNGLRAIGIELDDEYADLVIGLCKTYPDTSTAGILNAVLAKRRA
jgi:Holliday junction resolvasome RuvABC DNA-binding subunit